MADKNTWETLRRSFKARGVTLIAVSKTKPVGDIMALYEAGQRDFGENYVQELVEKQALLPADIRWHYIGHLQSNKVKLIAPFVYLIHAVDSYRLLEEINKYGAKNNRVIDILLQVHIADEDTKFGMDDKEIRALIDSYRFNEDALSHVRICGLMGMATNTEDTGKVRSEFVHLSDLFKTLAITSFAGRPYFSVCSMGMSADYNIAIDAGSNMVRIGSLLFGSR